MLRVVFSFILVLVLGAPAGAQIIGQYSSASALERDCTEALKWYNGERNNGVLSTVCIATINAFRLGVIVGAGGHRDAAKQIFGCTPNLFDNENFVRVFMAGLQARPDLKSKPYSTAISVIFRGAFPCR
jgi:hypothetical protein